MAVTAPRALTSPAPCAATPNAPTGVAVDFWASMICAALAPGAASFSSAATAAACGADSDVPKKRHTPPDNFAKNVVAPPSVAATSGLASTSGDASGAAGVVPLTGPK